MMDLGFKLYLVFVVSWFLHLGARFPFLGSIRIDFLLVIILGILAVTQREEKDSKVLRTDALLRVLMAYCILAIPFVEWPGSVIRYGIEALIKGLTFYYFTISFIKTEENLKTFILVFLGCQFWRILEPLYLHLTEGYWGSVASMANWEYLNRLAGAPYDTVNPNGLAFIICTVLPFLYFLGGLSRIYRLVSIVLMPLCVYALILTGSRSGIIGLFIIVTGIIIKTKNWLLGFICVLVVIIGFSHLDGDTQDRYLSIFGMGNKNLGTSEGRVNGVMNNLSIVLRRPIFGHGLGTSREVNVNFLGVDQPAHNLIAEVLQELGIIGLVIFVLFIRAIFLAFHEAYGIYSQADKGHYLKRLLDAMQVWLVMNLVFSFASYGLTSYEWYLFGGFSTVVMHLAHENVGSLTGPSAERPGKARKRRAVRVAPRRRMSARAGST
jgi:putative inorganic carbon (HCO3(-)) transporter